MQIWGLSEVQLHAALATASQAYKNNLRWKRAPEEHGTRVVHFKCTITVRDSGGPGARRTAEGYRLAAACWHAHRDFYRAVFNANPDARIKSALDDWRGVQDFNLRVDASGDKNIGGMMCPCAYRDACNC